ncbi:DUF6198 family protein [Apilactobacillus micheneri]|uniref:DUF6198 family protein n=1 Tax=Apilactobacillus micheneri TaxID=1899430 RepID=UPI0024533F52
MRKIVIYLIGINILSIGTVLFSCANLGVSALVSIPQILSLIFPITLGQATTIFFILLIIIEFILQRKFQIQIILQIVLAFVFGYIVDFYGVTLGLNSLNLPNLFDQFIIAFLAIVFTSIGIFIMVSVQFILIPPDGLVRIISELTKKQFGKVKFLFDLSTIVISILISLIFIGHIEAIGIGTVAAVILVGHLINLWDNIKNWFCINKSI